MSEMMSLLILITTTATVLGVIALAMLVYRGRRASPGVDPNSELARVLHETETALASRDGALGAQVAQLDVKLAALHETVAGREAALDSQMRGIGTRMQGIADLFTNDRARGGWAEIGMRRVFEQGGLVEGRDFTCQVSVGGVKPDAVVHLPGGRNIVIDAKFPIARYTEALVEEDAGRRRLLLVEQGKELERVGKTLTARGYAELAAGGYVVMYLPSQAVYEAAAEAHSDLIERLMAHRVVIAGPTALYALLLTVGALMTEFQALQQADRILDEARELHRRMSTFAGHLQGVGSGLAGAVRAFNGAVGSWGSKVAPQLERMTELTGRDQVGELSGIEDPVRELPEKGLRVVG
jgi:DNA recombination protein RmuC